MAYQGLGNADLTPASMNYQKQASAPVASQGDHLLSQQMHSIQYNIESSLTMIQKKMANIEQKVFATQKNVDSMHRVARQGEPHGDSSSGTKPGPRVAGRASTTAATRIEREGSREERLRTSNDTLKTMLQTLQK